MAGAEGGDAAGGFYSDFMVLRPDRGGLYDLAHLMWSCEVSKNAAVDCPAGTEIADWRRRWAVFVSLAVQVLLLSAKKPVALLGRTTEYWMNLVNENGGGVLGLLVRLCKVLALVSRSNRSRMNRSNALEFYHISIIPFCSPWSTTTRIRIHLHSF
jgi:hypothetical protein